MTRIHIVTEVSLVMDVTTKEQVSPNTLKSGDSRIYSLS